MTTALPALATLLSQCTREPAQLAPNPPPPPSPPPNAADAGSADLSPLRIDPAHIPPVPRAGAPALILPHPRTQSSAPMSASAPAPRAAAAAAPSSAGTGTAAAPAMPEEPGLYIVHNHPPGTACRPISQTELSEAAAALNAAP